MSIDLNRDQAQTDIDGRIMALEQNARGLNARMCALERSCSPEHIEAVVASRAYSGDTAADQQEIEDFVPAVDLSGRCEPFDGQDSHSERSGLQEMPVQYTDSAKAVQKKSLPIDITGLVAGLILVLISVLLFIGNMETLKNPVLPLVFGVVLIGCVAVKIRYG